MATAGKKMKWWIKDAINWWDEYFTDLFGDIVAFPFRLFDRALGFKERLIVSPALGYVGYDTPFSSLFRQIGRAIGSIIGTTLGLVLGIATFFLAPIFQKTPQQKLAASLKKAAEPLHKELAPVGKQLGLDKDEIEALADEAAENVDDDTAEQTLPLVKAIGSNTKDIARALAPAAPILAMRIPPTAKATVPAVLRQVVKNPQMAFTQGMMMSQGIPVTGFGMPMGGMAMPMGMGMPMPAKGLGGLGQQGMFGAGLPKAQGATTGLGTGGDPFAQLQAMGISDPQLQQMLQAMGGMQGMPVTVSVAPSFSSP